MLAFLSNFSTSFLVALLAWPFVAALLTLPVLIAQYRKYNRIHWRRVIGIYLFIFYGLGLLSFTLYPMPDNPAEFCRDYHLSPQLIPFTFVSDIVNEGLRAILQVIMNIAFFVPLGVFARLLLHWRLVPAIITALLISLTIETAQLTGVFGIYPCSYRLFDVDDLTFNTLGALLGYGMAMLIPHKELEYAKRGDIVTNAGAIRRLVGFAVDNMLVTTTTIILSIPLYLLNKQLGIDIQQILYVLAIVIFHFAIPFLGQGKTVGSRFVRMSLDNKQRTTGKRLIFYLLRLSWIAAFLLAPHGIPIIIGIITVFVWLIKKCLPYAVI